MIDSDNLIKTAANGNTIYASGAQRSNATKDTMPDFVSPFMLRDVSKVLTQVMGPNGKYPVDNWRSGLKMRQLMNSLERHLNAVKMGEDFDTETGQLHLAHLICNAMFALDNFYNRPECDDRIFRLDQRRIGLDIDNVICDFGSAWAEHTGVPNVGWYSSYDGDLFSELVTDEEFWMALKPLVHASDLKFEPVVYITSRTIPIEWTRNWLTDNGLVAAPIVTAKTPEEKAQACDEWNLHFFVDDKHANFSAINRLSKTHCYLMNHPHNQKWPVGYYRLNDLRNL